MIRDLIRMVKLAFTPQPVRVAGRLADIPLRGPLPPRRKPRIPPEPLWKIPR